MRFERNIHHCGSMYCHLSVNMRHFIGISCGCARAVYSKRTSSSLWIYCWTSIYRSIWLGCCPTHCAIRSSKWPRISDTINAERSKELPIWFSQTATFSLPIFYKTCWTIYKGKHKLLLNAAVGICHYVRKTFNSFWGFTKKYQWHNKAIAN